MTTGNHLAKSLRRNEFPLIKRTSIVSRLRLGEHHGKKGRQNVRAGGYGKGRSVEH